MVTPRQPSPVFLRIHTLLNSGQLYAATVVLAETQQQFGREIASGRYSPLVGDRRRDAVETRDELVASGSRFSVLGS